MDVDLIKPYTDGFEKIYDLTVPKKRYLIIGDSDNDQEAAKRLGVDFFLIDYFKSA